MADVRVVRAVRTVTGGAFKLVHHVRRFELGVVTGQIIFHDKS